MLLRHWIMAGAWILLFSANSAHHEHDIFQSAPVA